MKIPECLYLKTQTGECTKSRYLQSKNKGLAKCLYRRKTDKCPLLFYKTIEDKNE